MKESCIFCVVLVGCFVVVITDDKNIPKKSLSSNQDQKQHKNKKQNKMWKQSNRYRKPNYKDKAIHSRQKQHIWGYKNGLCQTQQIHQSLTFTQI